LAALMTREMADTAALTALDGNEPADESCAAATSAEKRPAEANDVRGVAQLGATRERLAAAIAKTRQGIVRLRGGIVTAEKHLAAIRRELAVARSREALGDSIGVVGISNDIAAERPSAAGGTPKRAGTWAALDRLRDLLELPPSDTAAAA